MHLTTQSWNKEGIFLFDYENEGYKITNHIIKKSSYILNRNKDIKIVKVSNNKNINIKNKEGYVGTITLNNKEEFIWNYNNYFEKDKFLKPYDSLDWIVIGPTQFSSGNDRKLESSYRLSEGDLIKLGKLIFLVRKIKINKNENKKNEDCFSSESINNNSNNMNLKGEENINNELIIYRFNRKNIKEPHIDSYKTLSEQKCFKNNINIENGIIINKINNRLKSLYLKIKNIKENNKLNSFKCRICFSDGSFEGKNPLISPCNCTGSVKYIHLNCLRKWLTSKVALKSSSINNIYCYSFQYLECEICKSIIPEQVEYRGKIISLLDFKEIEPPYLVLQTMNQYYSQNNNNLEYNGIFVISFKTKNYLIIGRANNSDIKLNDISVSRNHSIISYNNGDFYIDDIGSKFGTLLLIQNDILFLPYKEINIQTGKINLIFYLFRTCLALLKCYKNKLFNNMIYEKYFNSLEKKVYNQILENFNNYIVDPIEKFNSINNSYNSEDINNSITDKNIEKEENKDNIKNNSMISNKSIEEGCYINNENIDKIPTLNVCDLNHKDNHQKSNNTASFIIKKLNNSLIDENHTNSFQKQNESKEMLFQEINNQNGNPIKNIKKNNGTNFSILNIFKKNNNNTKSISILNKKFYNIFNKNFSYSSLNNKNNNDLPNTYRNNKKK